ncbi:MAG: Ig-like domain-containing protein, partial [Candidatus Thorarchaeota archaeon]
WEIEHNIRKNMNVTSTSYTGSKAANVTVGSSSYLYAQQELAYIDLNSSSELYLTFAYYIDDFTNLTNDYMEITLYFEDAEDSLRYVLANGSSRYSESDYFILLDSTQGQWHVEERELVVDYTSAFGMAPTDRLVGIYIEAQGEGRIEILLDDFYLYEDPAPTITNLIQNPTNPEYDDNATISVDVVDPHLDDVLLHFRINEGSFIIEEMNEQTPGTYQAVIPVLDYGDVVEYFISANDTYGKTTNLMDESTYFTYMVQDTILPSVSITNPENGSTVSDTIVITIEASDTGSDIQRVLIYIDSTLVANLTEGSFTHSWDTTEDTDGLHEIYVEAVDNADNINSCLHIVTVANNGSTTPTPTTDTTSGIPPPPDLALVVVIVGIAIGVTVVVIVLLLRTKKS